MDMRAKFSAVTKDDNQQDIEAESIASGSCSTSDVPQIVRMVSGSPPTGLKIGQHFCYQMRLLVSFREEMIVTMPLGGSNGKTADGRVVITAPTVSLKLQLPVNRQSLKQSKEFALRTKR